MFHPLPRNRRADERGQCPTFGAFLAAALQKLAGRSTLDCNVRNFSQDGTRIEFIDTATLPDEFDLTIARKETTYRARTVGRSESTAGVMLMGEQVSGVIPLDWARKLKAVEAQNRALRRHIAEFSEGTI